jgi:cobalt-zinc-cadmium efflux system membrane fusion protein
MKNIVKITTLFALLIISISCKKNNSQKMSATNEDVKKELKNAANILTLQLNQLNVMDITLGTVKKVNMGVSFKVNGQLELPPQNKASVSAIIGGRVQSIAVIEGDYVKKGQIIAQLNNPQFIKLQQDYLTARSNNSYLENDYKRKKQLIKDDITSKRSFQQAEAAYNESLATLNASKSMLQLIGINISNVENNQIISNVPVIAPINGYIQSINMNIGKFVAPEQIMFEIVDNAFLHLGLEVFEKDLDNVKIGQNISFSLASNPNKIYQAKIYALDKSFNKNTRSVKAHAKIIGNYEGLIEGMFVEARIITKNKEVSALPDEAFVSEKGLDYVFVQKNKTADKIEFEKTQVNKGISDLGYSEVLFMDELPENSIIVTKGAYYLNAEMQKSEFGDED